MIRTGAQLAVASGAAAPRVVLFEMKDREIQTGESLKLKAMGAVFRRQFEHRLGGMPKLAAASL